jgi:FixJ family two-component response regulator
MRTLYMTGHTDPVLLQNEIIDRGRDFLQKPFTIDVMVEKVRATLDAPAAKAA